MIQNIGGIEPTINGGDGVAAPFTSGWKTPAPITFTESAGSCTRGDGVALNTGTEVAEQTVAQCNAACTDLTTCSFMTWKADDDCRPT